MLFGSNKTAFKPKIIETVKRYNKDLFFSDVMAGIIVAIIDLPLTIALAIASGVTPNAGLYTTIVIGFITALIGGSKTRISGPTAAFTVILASTVATFGMPMIIASGIIAGVIIIIAGVLSLGKYIAKIPTPIVIGYGAGAGINVFIGQFKDFFGLKFVDGTKNITSIEKIIAVVKHIYTFNPIAFMVGIIALLMLIVFPKIFKKIPASFITIILVTLFVIKFDLAVFKINDLYAISSKPMSLQSVDFTIFKNPYVYINAFTFATVIMIETILTCRLADRMTNDTHNSSIELIAQGIGNIFSVLLGGIPAAGSLSRTTANLKNGAKTNVAGIIHPIVLFFILIGLMKYVGLIPMPVVASLLFIVGVNMAQPKTIINLIKSKNKKDIMVFLVCFAFTFLINLVVGIFVSLIVWAILNRFDKKKILNI